MYSGEASGAVFIRGEGIRDDLLHVQSAEERVFHHPGETWREKAFSKLPKHSSSLRRFPPSPERSQQNEGEAKAGSSLTL